MRFPAATAKPGRRLMPAMGRLEFRQWQRQRGIKASPRIRHMPPRQTIGACNTPRNWPKDLDQAARMGGQRVSPFDSWLAEADYSVAVTCALSSRVRHTSKAANTATVTPITTLMIIASLFWKPSSQGD